MAASGLKAQDTLLFENKWKLPVIIEEENEYEVIYRKAEWVNSPLYVIEKRFITNISYLDTLEAAKKFKSRPFDGSNIDLWVKPLDTNTVLLRGRLLHMDDTMLMVRHRGSFFPGKPKIRSELVSVITYDHIQRLEYRKRSKMRKSAIIGAATGFVAGTLTGLLFFNDTPACENGGIDGKPPCDPNLKSPMTRFEKSLILGAGAATGGFVTGGIIGGVRIKFIIGGKKDRYNQAIPHILRSLN
ncbi:MAG: hypothetical protein D6816_14915 [Bacteroidetes bacterium]|nr:MAG: hypothetical protein D6816_14915 [Bacteroidota bacterium]